MVEAVVSVAVQTLGDLLVEKGKFLLNVEGEVQSLQRQLRAMKWLLKDAHRKRHQSESVRSWMGEIRDLTYRAEDAIGVYAAERFSLLPNPTALFSAYKLRSEISDIMAELTAVTNNMQNKGIIVDEADDDNLSWRRMSLPHFLIGDCFVGKDDELQQILCRLADDEHRVVSVWGMGGIGKTTIAKKVYNLMSEAKQFESFAWVCVTQQCQIRSVLEDVLRQLVPERVISSVTPAQLIEQLWQIQRAKRCLIVLDDLWETSHWEGLKHAFLDPDRDSKSKILVTTRRQDVAEMGFPMELDLLKEEDAWELLKKKTFPRGDIPDFALQESICVNGKQMVKKCGGLPLAISLLGGVLREKDCPGEWELVNKNMDTYLYRQEAIDAVLNLSYDNLPHHLKLCFLYLGVLREDQSMAAVDLYRVWIAQGLILDKDDDTSQMELAKIYLGELASRSIVQVELHDGQHTKKFKSCKLHDVVRKLCLSMGKKENYRVQTLEYEGGRFSAFLDDALARTKTRHLVIYLNKEPQDDVVDDDDGVRVIGEDDDYKHVRSLHLHNFVEGKTHIELPSEVDFGKFKSLRSLVLVKFKSVGGELLSGITSLVHLRNLRFRYCEIDELPRSISNLVYLEILDFLYSKNTRIPPDLKKMFRLKQLLLPHYDGAMIRDYILRLDQGFDQLEALLGLNSLVHESSRYTRMKKLQRFSAVTYDNGSYAAILSAISTNWNKLVYTFVVVEDGCVITPTELRQAFKCQNLFDLAIHVPLENLLTECRGDIISSNISSLSLKKCSIEEDPMEILGSLPSLRQLIFHLGSFVGERMTCPALSFPRLKLFKLIDLPGLREWTVGGGAMPFLLEMHICRCDGMEMVPEGLSGISTLQTLTIKGMPELGRRVSPSGEDFHKVRHVRLVSVIP